MYGALQNENESAAMRSLAVLTELYRRHVWRDARTVNVIGEHVNRDSDVLWPGLRFKTILIVVKLS